MSASGRMSADLVSILQLPQWDLGCPRRGLGRRRRPRHRTETQQRMQTGPPVSGSWAAEAGAIVERDRLVISGFIR